MNISLIRLSIHAAVQLSFSRSGGPGGQNVNKVNTKVEARVRLDELEGLSQNELQRVKEVLSTRLVEESVLRIVSSEERTQMANRERALARLEALICSAARIPKRRLATKPSRSSIERRLKSKQIRSGAKRDRGTLPNQDE